MKDFPQTTKSHSWSIAWHHRHVLARPFPSHQSRDFPNLSKRSGMAQGGAHLSTMSESVKVMKPNPLLFFVYGSTLISAS
jgi:hypothetical protein